MVNILQSGIMTDFVYPLMLIFVIVFAILEKTEIFGKGNKQLNAFIGLVVALIFVGAVFPKLIVENMILYMSVALIVIFVALMLWGFVSGNSDLTVADGSGRKIRKLFAFLILGATVFAVFWATGIGGSIVEGMKDMLSFLFGSGWSGEFWNNFLFIAIIAIGVMIVLGFNPFKNFGKNPWIKLK